MSIEQMILEKKKLKIEHKIEIAIIDDKIKIAKTEKSKEYKKQNTNKLKILDIFIILAVLSNIGALVITNTLVLKNSPEKTLYEANPGVAEKFDYQLHPEAASKMIGFLKYVFGLVMLVFYYVYLRNTVYNSWQYYTMILFVFFVFGMLFFDFANDFGFLLGRWLT